LLMIAAVADCLTAALLFSCNLINC
jgi:hypothetical protein